jgi:CDP-6-deoxy-D-xylo-4-hexulose-3-dehydrase
MKIRYARNLFNDSEIRNAVKYLFKDQWMLGKQTLRFETELANYQQLDHALFVNSGSSALLLAFHALRQHYPKKYVIVPAVQFPTLTSSLLLAGYLPYFVDVDKTLSISIEALQKINFKDVAGIVVVHVAGNIGRVDQLVDLTQKHQMFLLEDNCDGFGGGYLGRKIGSFGTISVTSFHMAHIISTGQGGAIFTNNADLFNLMKSYREWGRKTDFDDEAEGISPLPKDYLQRYTYITRGFNVTPLEFQAALGCNQLKRIDTFLAKRSYNYNLISRWAYEAGLNIVETVDHAFPAWFAVPLFSPQRSQVIKKLKQWNIEFRNILTGNITYHPAYRTIYKAKSSNLSYANKVLNEGFWISCHSSLTCKELNYIQRFFKIAMR